MSKIWLKIVNLKTSQDMEKADPAANLEDTRQISWDHEIYPP